MNYLLFNFEVLNENSEFFNIRLNIFTNIQLTCQIKSEFTNLRISASSFLKRLQIDMEDGNEPVFRAVMIGDACVGKTSLVMGMKGMCIDDHYEETVGAAFDSFNTYIDGRSISIQIWDTAGQERYKALGPVYYRSANAAVIVFDVTNEATYTDIEEWMNAFTSVAGNNACIFLVANKIDLENEINVDLEEAEEWANEHHAIFFKTSAKLKINVMNLFKKLAEEIYWNNKSLNPVEKYGIEKIEQEKSCC
ncbi:Ras-related protein Rab-5A [Tritrichomonas foetus]|uniref:Ras-related protein Rab-5A n=1 Tax=Tritrichomonas foetus TaxID=1144522 RepID=A0A1J4JRX4_9EUKA|nr:Ras-related protein Rab-5A [Tritrichomonas foetus]|eukprot:OHT00260.1 Ras-related protein Rab-5A [Tritrichomonas foetus]